MVRLISVRSLSNEQFYVWGAVFLFVISLQNQSWPKNLGVQSVIMFLHVGRLVQQIWLQNLQYRKKLSVMFTCSSRFYKISYDIVNLVEHKYFIADSFLCCTTISCNGLVLLKMLASKWAVLLNVYKALNLLCESSFHCSVLTKDFIWLYSAQGLIWNIFFLLALSNRLSVFCFCCCCSCFFSLRIT